MASLVSNFPALFASSTIAKGQGYFSGGAVRIDRETSTDLDATVRGSERYTVELEREGPTLSACCDCPHFEDYGSLCKHIVATILCAESKGSAIVSGAIDFLKALDDLSEYIPVGQYRMRRGPARTKHAPPRPPKPPPWRQQLSAIAQAAAPAVGFARQWASGRELFYVVDAFASSGESVTVEIDIRERKMNGEWGAFKQYRFQALEPASLPDADDRRIVSAIGGGRAEYASSYNYGYSTDYSARYRLSTPLAVSLVREMCETGRCRLRVAPAPSESCPITWDAEPWRLRMELQQGRTTKDYTLEGSLVRGTERRGLDTTVLVAGGLVFDQDRVAPLDAGGDAAWVDVLRRAGKLRISAAEADDFLAQIYALPSAPRIELPRKMKLPEVSPAPLPQLKIKPSDRYRTSSDNLLADLSFDYDGAIVEETAPGRIAFDRERRRLVVRDPAVETAASDRLAALGFRWTSSYYGPRHRELSPKRLSAVVRQLLVEGWHVEAEGKLYRTPGKIRVEVSSGIDWFNLAATVDYGGVTASLPDLLAALRRGDNVVQLDDGTFGMLPETWLQKYGMLAGFGEAEAESVRFRRSQIGLLDALLADQPEARVDRVFAKIRSELARFTGIEPTTEPASFQGELRPYQREGLGWLLFLQRFGFGGCLADDMGLGKTVTVLALLEARRAAPRGKKAVTKPSLVVVPKSLVFNWKLEAARFAPMLRVLDHTGTERPKSVEGFAPYDLVLTTYGTLRRDAVLFHDAAFDYVILDEAQAIKNASTDSAKAARLLTGDHRLAMSGTPIENHLGELWSLFEFLNPGLLGTASAFRIFGVGGRSAEPESRELLAKALRPFMLRRTKEQVAKDLPAKTEQTIYCELEPSQRKLYDQLLRHYREALLGRIATEGLAKSKIQVLEALLRLRQAACHPGLIDKMRAKESSAKLDVLLDHLREIVAEGHKVLVFSQFTSLLSIVRAHLDREGAVYEYLDGKTRDRAARVARFQEDADCKMFLISLKAGGLGLNLTAAEYVFLLDPWWNPAVEAQAVDRAYRIGQTRNVFAYRLIAKDTVEEKVLELQASKRELADAIVRADASLIRNLSADDLRLLLS